MSAKAVIHLSLLISATLFLSCCMFACKPKSQSDLHGIYAADYNIAEERLSLNKDGTFNQEVTLKATSTTNAAKGTWTYDPVTGYVTFDENFMVVVDGFRQLKPDYARSKAGLVVLPADKYFGSISLGSAEGVLYKKIG